MGLENLGMKRSIKLLNEQKVQKWLEDHFEFDPNVSTCELSIDNHGAYRVVISGTKCGHIVGRGGQKLRDLKQSIKTMFDIDVNISVKDLQKKVMSKYPTKREVERR